MHIKPGELDDKRVIELLEGHLHSMTLHSPPESIHALDIRALQKPNVRFWTAWHDGEVMGCAALKTLDGDHGEIKSMKTAPNFLRRGVASRLLKHVIEQAARSGYRRVSLETGSAAAFDAARQLYEKFDFIYCKPFADYSEDPHSVFMTKSL